MTDQLPEVSVSPVRKVFLSGASVVWAIPLLALLVALYIAWQSYTDRGPLITVEFEQGAGITAGETELKYRDVTVGVVERVGFTTGLEKVTATIRVQKEVAPFIDNSAVFWIVQPEVTAQGITGLSTVLSGVYIEGSWDDQPGAVPERFSGASQAPLIRPGRRGLEIAFRTTPNSQLTDNAPILFKGIEVGRLGRARIAPRGNFAIVEGLIYDEHRGLINRSTRFWDTSGFSVSIGPAGAEIDFSSLATLVGGGITFDTFVSGGGRVPDGTVFEVFPDRETARNSIFSTSEVDPLDLSIIFDDNIAGLTVGAPVELSGLRIGQVEALNGISDFDQFGDSRVRLNATISVQPARLGLQGDVTSEAAFAFLRNRVAEGLRARLASAGLLTGGLKVELIMVPEASEARLAEVADGLPTIPTTFNEVSDAAATVEGVFTRLNNLPIEELLNSAINFLNSADAFISNEDLAETPADVRALLAALSGLVTSDEVQNIPVSLNATLTRIETLVTELETQRLASKLSETLDSATRAAQAVETSVAGVPDLVAQIEGVAQKANNLALEELVADVSELASSANALLTAEDTVALPSDVRGALARVDTLLREMRAYLASEAVQTIPSTISATLTRVDGLVQELETQRIATRLADALDGAATAAGAVESSVAGVPELVAQIQEVAQKAEDLALEGLIADLSTLTASANKILESEETQALPAEAREALETLETLLTEVRGYLGSEVVQNIPATLNSALVRVDGLVKQLETERVVARLGAALDGVAAAAQDVGGSVAGVPELIADIQSVADKANSLEVETFLTELTALTRSADALIASDDAAALPGSLKRALDQLNMTLQELRDGGAVTNVNRTLASARNAADAIAVSTEDLPQIVERLSALFEQASDTIEGYNKGEQLSRTATATLRDIQKAADALASLAKTIERNPNSLLLGR